MVSELGERIRLLNNALSCVELVRRFAPSVELRKHSSKELAGECPKCGGFDRFYVSTSYAACRQCHTQRMDAVGLTAWLLNVSQREAAERLGGVVSVSVSSDTDTRSVKPSVSVSVSDTRSVKPSVTDTAWQGDAEKHVREAAERLGSPVGHAAREYLRERGFTPDTWRKFQLGFVPSVHVPRSEERVGAISWPIVNESDNGVVAVKYRFMEPTANGLRYAMRRGSSVTARLFGVHALPAWVAPWNETLATVERWGCLLVCEGELNAVAIAQACEPFGVAVLSTGSESQSTLPAWVVSMARRFGCVVTWFDKPDAAQSVHAQIARADSQAVALRSPIVDGVKLDANEMLKRGLLSAFVLGAWLRAMPDAEHVLWQAYDVAGSLGVDGRTAKIMTKHAERLGWSVTLEERDARYWWQP